MRVVYLCAGLFAEGDTDYEFLLPLLDRLLPEVASRRWPSRNEVAPSAGIDAPVNDRGGSRAARIAAAVGEFSGCNVFVIHSDGEGDPERCYKERVLPGITEAQHRGEEPFAVAPCLPVRETESWLLADPLPFRLVYGSAFSPVLPPLPERELDPKLSLREILRAAEGGSKLPPEGRLRELLPLFGTNVRLDCLRRLPSFQRFESALEQAAAEMATHQGFPTE